MMLAIGLAIEFAVGATLAHIYGLGSVVLAAVGMVGVKIIAKSDREKS